MHQGRFTPWTMKSDHGRWPFFHGPTKRLGPSLGVNRTCTKRNDHAPTSKCVDVFSSYYMSKKGSFEKEKKIKFDHSFVFSCLHLLVPIKWIHWIFYYNNISLQWPLPFSTITHCLPLPPQNPLDHVRQWIMLVLTRGDHWAKIVEQCAIKNRVQYIHCR
jgi:hypothetical protein